MKDINKSGEKKMKNKEVGSEKKVKKIVNPKKIEEIDEEEVITNTKSLDVKAVDSEKKKPKLKKDKKRKDSIDADADADVVDAEEGGNGEEEEKKSNKDSSLDYSNVNKVVVKPSSIFSTEKFSELPIQAKTQEALKKMGFDFMTLIQSKSIPECLAGSDLVSNDWRYSYSMSICCSSYKTSFNNYVDLKRKTQAQNPNSIPNPNPNPNPTLTCTKYIATQRQLTS
jgi:hypothetical protein